ncbi:MAG: ribonuclease III [Actinomycetota bacterium]|nr:ribonuclease III [Actinomycetota bacterium]
MQRVPTTGDDADRPGLAELESRLEMQFSDDATLRRALTHRSFAFEHGGLPTNERLEFLGDAVLTLVVTDLIFHQMHEAPEGRLTKLRAAATRTATLADVARALELGRFVRLGKGEVATGGTDKDSILADTFEAVLGAVYLDRGFEAASALVRRLFAERLESLATRGAALDYKTSLQELAAARSGSLPVYALHEEGPDHAPEFTAVVSVDGIECGRGTGGSKKKAEQAAAREAYRLLSRSDRSAPGADAQER